MSENLNAPVIASTVEPSVKPDNERCDSEVYRKGKHIATLDARSANAQIFVELVAKVSCTRMDWHYSGGRAIVLCLGTDEDCARARAKLDELSSCLTGHVLW